MRRRQTKPDNMLGERERGQPEKKTERLDALTRPDHAGENLVEKREGLRGIRSLRASTGWRTPFYTPSQSLHARRRQSTLRSMDG